MLRILYAGSPDISSVVLESLIQSKQVQIVCVLTNPPSPQGRHKTLIETPVATVARNKGIPVLEPEKLDACVREQIKSFSPDLLVCFAYGKIFGPKFMDLFPQGGINLHPSLLPKYRGCAPVPAALLSGDEKTGITIQRLAQKMDSGDILLQKELLLTGNENTGSLLEKVGQMGGDLLLQVLYQIDSGTENPVPQKEEDATFCQLLKKEDGLIDWDKTAKEIDCKIRAFNPWPGAYTIVNDTMLRIHQSKVYNSDISQAQIVVEEKDRIPGKVIGTDQKEGILIQTGSGIIAVQNLQWQAKNAMNCKDFMNGSRNFPGTICK